MRELKGFQRVTLKPGELRRLSFRLRRNELRDWNAASRPWVVDDTSFDVWGGGSSQADLAGKFDVRG